MHRSNQKRFEQEVPNLIAIILYPIIIALSLFLQGCAPESVSNDTVITYVLAGQSNLSGSWQENLGELPSDNVTETHRLPDWSFSPITHYKRPNYGPSTNIARALEAKYPGKKILIVNAAAGGSTMSDWRQDQTGGLYLPTIKYLQTLTTKIEGFLWYQGESDAGTIPGYQQPYIWAQLFETLMTSFKTDLNQPNLPIVFAQIATTTNVDLPNWNIVKAQQVIAQQHTGYNMVITEDLSLCDDVHLVYTEFNKLATRFISTLN